GAEYLGIGLGRQLHAQGAVAIIGGMENFDHGGLSMNALEDGAALLARIRQWAGEFGFGAVGVADVGLGDAEAGLAAWLEAGYHGEMDYMARHGMKRARPAELLPGTLRVISCR